MNGLVWFKNDLRTIDNHSLYNACRENEKVIGIYCLDPRNFETTKYGFKKTEQFRTQSLLGTVAELQEKLAERDNISVITNAQVTEVYGEAFTTGLKYKERATEEMKDLKIDGMFVEIGLVPNTEFVKGYVETTKFGEIIINDVNSTNVKGIFAAGDVTTVKYKQIIIAMGEGAKAALGAFDYLIKEY